MSDDKTTPGEGELTPGETGVTQDHGTNSEASATGSEGNEGSENIEEGKKPEAISREEYEKLQKEFQKIEMDRNRLKNQQEEERRKALEEQGNWEQIAKEHADELERIKAEREVEDANKQATKLREKFINEYPNEQVRKAAKALIERNPSNIAWGDVQSEEQAQAEIVAQLDALKETMGIVAEDQGEDFEISANNPATSQGNSELDKLRSMSSDDLRKVLPHADSR